MWIVLDFKNLNLDIVSSFEFGISKLKPVWFVLDEKIKNLFSL